LPRERHCRRHGGGACSCEMGNLYRFVEPIVLLSVAVLKEAYGYQIAQAAEEMAVTHAGLDMGGIYRALRRLENNGHVLSNWDTGSGGPARRIYRLTERGRKHLAEWAEVLAEMLIPLTRLQKACSEAADPEDAL
jgi:PadR family transcriptional regulator PadR